MTSEENYSLSAARRSIPPFGSVTKVTCRNSFIIESSRGVAQPGSAPALGAGGPRFKSARPDHFPAIQLSRCPILNVAPLATLEPALSEAEGVEFHGRSPLGIF